MFDLKKIQLQKHVLIQHTIQKELCYLWYAENERLKRLKCCERHNTPTMEDYRCWVARLTWVMHHCLRNLVITQMTRIWQRKSIGHCGRCGSLLITRNERKTIIAKILAYGIHHLISHIQSHQQSKLPYPENISALLSVPVVELRYYHIVSIF